MQTQGWSGEGPKALAGKGRFVPYPGMTKGVTGAGNWLAQSRVLRVSSEAVWHWTQNWEPQVQLAALLSTSS